jgi:hypothetical protein
MEPERKIEKLLRACAKKRRAEAGDSLKLHPANRRLLLGKAARRAPTQASPRREPGEDNLFRLLLTVFRRRPVFVLCIVATVFLGVSMFLPALNSAKKKAQNVSAMSNLKEIDRATRRYAEDNKDVRPASLDKVTNELGTSGVLIGPVSGKLFVHAGGGEKLDGLQSNTVLFAGGRVETVTGARIAELTNQKTIELALADKSARERTANAPAAEPVATAMPVPTRQTTGELEKTGLHDAVSQNFVQAGTASNLQNLFRNASASAQTAPVLQSFQVQPNGDAISVLDRDGSVYNGSWQLTNATARNEPAPTETPAAPAKGKMTPAAGSESQAAQYYFFRVAGTNRTLKQYVVFTGNLLANSAAPQTAQASNFLGVVGGGGGARNQFQPNAANASRQSLLSNSRIVGTAVIDNTNQIEINAVPATP